MPFSFVISRFYSDIQAARALTPQELSKFLNDLSAVSVFNSPLYMSRVLLGLDELAYHWRHV